MAIQYSSQPSICIHIHVHIRMFMGERLYTHRYSHTCMYVRTRAHFGIQTNYLVVVLLQYSAEELEMIYPCPHYYCSGCFCNCALSPRFTVPDFYTV